MPTYAQLAALYKKRRRDTLADTVTTALSYADNITVDLGLLDDSGLLCDIAGGACGVLPFALIAVTEQAKVLRGVKKPESGLRDTAVRMAKTGVAMGVGAAAGALGGVIAAVPAAVGSRVLFDAYRSRAFTGCRVAGRTARLRELRDLLASPVPPPGQELLDAPTE